ncbi:uncharacterized protein LOC143517610 [Brachyhypopomus gauderio]|uniref:uncharacterized protein LOC143517610 n=1 Tax=Brachyhypopomus gauderio TaxID=698409 RepID=UPI0040438A55
MTRLHHPLHRPNPRVWMEEAQSRDSFITPSSSSHVSSVGRERDSGYFSLGRASGSRTFQDKSPPPPHRHSERGHPLPNNHTPEPKAIIPFRNPDLGVPSQRRTSEIQNLDLDPELELGTICLDPVDLSIAVEAQVGPRSPSPTPFKQAESLALSGRTRARTGFTASHSPPRAFSSSRQASVPSRSSSPGRVSSNAQRAKPVSHLTSKGFLPHESLRSRSPSQNSYDQLADSGGLQRNFRAFASSVGSISTTAKSLSSVCKLRGGLQQTEGTSRRGSSRWSSSPSKQIMQDHSVLQKVSSSPNSHRRESRSPSPSSKGYERNSQSFLQKDQHSAFPIRKGYGASSQSETNHKSNGQSHESANSSAGRRSLEPVSKSLRKSETSNTTRSHSHDSRDSSPTRRGYDTPNQSVLRKHETSRFSNVHGFDSRSPSPSRRSYNTSSQSLPRKSETSNTTRSHSHDSRNSSPTRRSYDTSNQSVLRKHETSRFSNVHGFDSRSPSPSRRSYDTSSRQSLPRKSETSNITRSHSHDSRDSSPTRRSYDTPNQSVLRKHETSRFSYVRGHDSRSPSPSRRSYDTSSQSLPRKSETSNITRSHSHDSRDSSPTRRGYDTPNQSVLQKHETSRFSYVHGHDSRSPSSSRRSYDTSQSPHKSDTNSHKSGRNSPSKAQQDSSGQNILHKTLSNYRAETSRVETSSCIRKSGHNRTQSDSWHTKGSQPGSTHSINNLPSPCSSSPSRKNSENKVTGYSQRPAHVAWETIKNSSSSRRSQEAHTPSTDSRKPSHLNTSHSPHVRIYTSSQSSMESCESGHVSASSCGLNREEYDIMADIPKVKPLLQRAEPNQLSTRNRDEPSLFKPASHSHSRVAYSAWDESGDQWGRPCSSPPHTQQGSSVQTEDETTQQARSSSSVSVSWCELEVLVPHNTLNP